MSTITAPFEIESCFVPLYEICINNHLKCFPEPRLFTLDDWKCAGTKVLVRRLRAIYPRPIKVGNKLLTIEWPNQKYEVGPYKILIQELGCS